MATLTALVPNGTVAAGGWTASASTLHGDTDDTIAGADDAGSYMFGQTDATTTAGRLDLTAVDADFGSMDTCTVSIRGRVFAWGDDDFEMTARLFTAGGSPLTSLYTITASATWGSAWTTSTSGNIVTDTSSGKATWDGAYIEVVGSVYTKNKSFDTARIEITAVEVNGTYTVAVAERFHRNLRPRGNLVTANYY